jgi:Ca2+-binding EF-hand superfamily protein
MPAIRFTIVLVAALGVPSALARAQGFGGGGGGWMMGGGPPDPNQMFDRFANGKEVIIRSEITDPQLQFRFDRMAERMGITDGRLTREQFVTFMQQRMANWQGGRGGAPGQPGVPGAGGGPPGPDAWAGWAENMFRRLDQNGDGYLNNDEMPEDLRGERDKWDADHNGLIDLNEFKAYFQARMQQRMAERGPDSWSGGAAAQPLVVTAPEPVEEERRPVVYRSGKLPKELPAWFQQLDTNADGQVALYEWRAAGRPIDEFLKMDRNGDGFLTAQEVLAYQAKQPKNGPTQMAGAPSLPGNFGPPGFASAPDGAGFAGRGNGRPWRGGFGNRGNGGAQ